ncbi:hypothetical protein C5167_006104 [Papaver somniferum]|uniref:Uncharacterized protein n=1 Tax=Papaver somniferum TaxID=3469 RepID=A0A4Y7JGM8_PAPSO|nr:hypothetical protein C5167_006104 [Papaver somniferum]
MTLVLKCMNSHLTDEAFIEMSNRSYMEVVMNGLNSVDVGPISALVFQFQGRLTLEIRDMRVVDDVDLSGNSPIGVVCTCHTCTHVYAHMLFNVYIVRRQGADKIYNDFNNQLPGALKN